MWANTCSRIVRSHGSAQRGQIERIPPPSLIATNFLVLGEPVVTLSTHMDTGPPFLVSREDARFFLGRGSCDARELSPRMVGAAEKIAGPRATHNFGLLFVCGEETQQRGGRAARRRPPRGSRFLINGDH